MEQQTKANNTQLAVVTREYNVYRPDSWHRHHKARLMHFKAAASYAVKIIEDPTKIKYDAWGNPYWREVSDDFHGIGIYDDCKYEVALFRWDKSVYFEEIRGIPELYSAVMYVLTAMNNAREKVLADSRRQMTPAEIEKEFRLSRGTVRKYIFDHRQQLESAKVIRQADKRTLLCKRGWAFNRWGDKSNVRRD